MICVSIACCSAAECLEMLKDIHFGEIRMDLMNLTQEDIYEIFSAPVDLIATFRPGNIDEKERKGILLAAIDAGASYVDIEVESGVAFKNEIIDRARSKGCIVIVSHHDFEKTPERDELLSIVSACFESGGDIAKIACKVNSKMDNARLLGLLDSKNNIIVVGMGEMGRITRVVAPYLGSPFTYASSKKGKETTEGQIDIETIEKYMDLLSYEKR